MAGHKKNVEERTGYVRAKITRTEQTQTVVITSPVMEGYVDMKVPQKYHFNNGGFITIFQQALMNIIKFANLTKNEMKLLIYLMASCKIDNSVCVDLDILTNELGIAKPNVSTALKGLVQRNIVIRKDGYRYDFSPLPMELRINYDQINYNLAYNGSTKTFRKNKTKHLPITERDGMTLLEDHTHGEPIRSIDADGLVSYTLPFEEVQVDEELGIAIPKSNPRIMPKNPNFDKTSK